jgi:hypothetical protein
MKIQIQIWGLNLNRIEIELENLIDLMINDDDQGTIE